MALMSQDERRIAEGVSQLMYCNPFLPERKELERAILGNTGSADGVWSKRSADSKLSPAVTAIADVVEELIGKLRTKVKVKLRFVSLFALETFQLLHESSDQHNGIDGIRR